jgi:hypothetical protein
MGRFLVAFVCVSTLAFFACGGGGSPAAPTPPTVDTPGAPSTPVTVNSPLGWTFTPDAGTRGTGVSGNPSAVGTGGRTLMFLGGEVAQSSDGLTFTTIPSFVITFPSNGGGPVSIVDMPGGYRMYYGGFLSPFMTATSSDGTHWTSGTPVLAPTTTFGWIKVVALPGSGAGYRAFYHPGSATDGDIHSMFSTDGLTFTEEGVRLQGGQYGWLEPSVVYAANGGWLMAVSTQGVRQAYDDIFLATSSDGLAWTADKTAILSSAGGTSYFNPSVVVQGSTIRVYFQSNSGPRSFSGGTSLASGMLTRSAANITHVLLAPTATPPIHLRR